MTNGFIVNNTGRARYIFKRTVHPGQQVPLPYIQKLLERQVPEGETFVKWLESYIPEGWELHLEPEKNQAVASQEEYPYRETLLAVPEVVSGPDQLPQHKAHNVVPEVPEAHEVLSVPEVPVAPVVPEMSMQYAVPKKLRDLTSKQIYELKVSDNPRRVLSHITSLSKLRRALNMCKGDAHKTVLSRMIMERIRQLNLTL